MHTGRSANPSRVAARSAAIVSMSRGLVRVQLGTITAERAATLDGFADRPVCIDGQFA
jgi:hypothetical protein